MSPTPISGTLVGLAAQAFDAFHHARRLHADWVTPHSHPIAWFGDAPAFASSKLRVMTTGLNPSQVEFPAHDPGLRFPKARGATSASPAYVAGLNDYFRTAPYWQWFNTYKTLLEGLGATYTGAAGASTAIHTDLLSPVATSPTWSKLPKTVTSDLANPGLALWHDLVRAMRPDVILLSVAKEHLERITLPAIDAGWGELHAIKQPKGVYRVLARRFDADGHPTLIVWGRAAQTPFGGISYPARHKLGARIREAISG